MTKNYILIVGVVIAALIIYTLHLKTKLSQLETKYLLAIARPLEIPKPEKTENPEEPKN